MEYVPAMGGVMLFGGYHNFQSYSDTWVYQCLGVGPAALPAGRVGLAYAASLTATGGSAPCSFTLTVGSLPPGLTLAADGTISGTPASAGSFAFRVLAADATGCLGSVIATIAIDEAIESFVAAEGAGPANANRIRAYDAAGRPTPVDFFAYAAGTYGVRVATGHVVAAGTEEILTGPGPGPVHGPHVRAFGDDGSPIARVSFFAFGTLRYGVGVASCALDATAQMEMLAGAGPGAVFGPHVRAFTFDGSVVAPLPGASFYAYGTLRFGANVGAGDVDGAPPAEILTGPGPGPTFGAHVRAFAYAGSITPLSRIDFFAIPGSGHGCGVAGGDVDADGFDELCASAGPGAPVAARTVGFEDDGSGVRALPGFDATPFPSAYGARSSLGDVSVVIDDGRSDLVCGAGPDPAASSLVLVFRYDGAALVAVPGSFAPFPDPYGVDATSGALGL
ncbi:MAG: Ig domain-containing protein [Acidobacteriota bacterium]